MLDTLELQLWKDVLVAAGHTPKLNPDGSIWVNYDRQDYHLDVVCTTCYEAWCIYCIDINQNPDLIELCDPS